MKETNSKSVWFKNKGQKGFSLMEVMIVIAIIAIISAISLPNLMNSNRKVKKVARELLGDVQATRLSAVNSNRNWSIVFGVNGYSIFSDPSGANVLTKTVTFTGENTGVAYGGGVATENVPGTAAPFAAISYVGSTLTFNPQGSSNNGYVYLFQDNFSYAVGSSNSTGNIRIRVWSNGAWR